MFYYEDDECEQELLRAREQAEYDSLVDLDQRMVDTMPEWPCYTFTEDELLALDAAESAARYPSNAIEQPNANEIDWEREIALDQSGEPPMHAKLSPIEFFDYVMGNTEKKGEKRKAEGKPRGSPTEKRLKSDPIAISENWKRLRKYSIPRKDKLN